MGLRDEAEKIIAEENRRAQARAEEGEKEERKHLARARGYVPRGMRVWAQNMGLESVPHYTVTEPGWGTSVDVSFSQDGVPFKATVKHGMSAPWETAPEFTVWFAWRDSTERDYRYKVNTVEDLARALKSQDTRRREIAAIPTHRWTGMSSQG